MSGDFQFKTWEEALLHAYKDRITGIAQNILIGLLTHGALKDALDTTHDEPMDTVKALRPAVERSVILARYLCELTEDLSLPPKILTAARARDQEVAEAEAKAKQADPESPPESAGWQYACTFCGEATSAPPRIVDDGYYPSCCSRKICADKYDRVPLDKVDPALVALVPSSDRIRTGAV